MNTFKILNDRYAKDDKNVYFSGNKSFEDVDSKTFEVPPNYYSKDKNGVYHGYWEIKGLDSESFKIIVVSGKIIIKDKNDFIEK